jgi:DNA-binding protein Fis
MTPFLTLSEVILRAVDNALVACNGNKSQAARLLGVNRRTLIRWCQGYQPVTGPRKRVR